MCPPDTEIEAFLLRARRACAEGRVLVSEKAADEAWEDLSWRTSDIILQIQALRVDDFHDRVASTARPSDLIWVMCPETTYEGSLYIRLVERKDLIIVSFHRR